MKGNPIAPELFEEEVKALMEVGGYSSEREVLSHSLEILLLANPTLRLGVAIHLYKENKVTLEKGSEIAGIGFERFKEELAKSGVTSRASKSALNLFPIFGLRFSWFSVIEPFLTSPDSLLGGRGLCFAEDRRPIRFFVTL